VGEGNISSSKSTSDSGCECVDMIENRLRFGVLQVSHRCSRKAL
jgi:hypothetical protein